MFNFIKLGDQYTVFVGDKIYEGTPEDQSAFIVDLHNENEDLVIKHLSPERYFESVKNKILESIAQFDEFSLENGYLFYKNIPYALPDLLVDKIVKAYDDHQSLLQFVKDITPYTNFWGWCALNPNVHSRKQLFNFLDRAGIQITKDGMLVCYRNVNVKQEGDLELTEFVSQQYTRIKKWKKSPKDYIILRDSSGNLQCTTVVTNKDTVYGNLQGLYDNIDRFESVFTDNYTGKFRIELNKPVVMDREKCDPDPDSDCSHGLHVGGASFLRSGDFGNKPIAVLVNPMNVVAVPAYNQWKMRVCEYMPFAIVEYDEDNNIRPIDTEVIEFDYSKYSIDELYSAIDYPHDPDHADGISAIAGDKNVYLNFVDNMRELIDKRVTYLFKQQVNYTTIQNEEDNYYTDEYNYYTDEYDYEDDEEYGNDYDADVNEEWVYDDTM